MSLAPESSWHRVDPVSMLQPPGGAVITPSQALGTTASSQSLYPRGKSLNLDPWSSAFQLSSFTVQTGGSFSGSWIGAGDSWV